MLEYTWVVELAVKPGKEEQFQTLREDMISAIDLEEPGTLVYVFFLKPDGTGAHIFEQYRDGAAFQAHLDNFNRSFVNRFAETVDVVRFTAYGDTDPETQETLAGFGAEQLILDQGVYRG